jgi:hypothetical protein
MRVIILYCVATLLAQFRQSCAFFKSSNMIKPIGQGFAHLYFWLDDPNRKTGF